MLELVKPKLEETAIELTNILRWEDVGGQTRQTAKVSNWLVSELEPET